MSNNEPKRPNRTTIELPRPMRQRLEALAESTGRTQSEIIREAVQQYLDARPKAE